MRSTSLRIFIYRRKDVESDKNHKKQQNSVFITEFRLYKVRFYYIVVTFIFATASGVSYANKPLLLAPIKSSPKNSLTLPKRLI